jgi:arsenite methyltransferase
MTATVDTQELEAKVKVMYRHVALQPHDKFHFELGAQVALRVGYDGDLLAAGLVGPSGHVYGVDFTQEQLDKARRLATDAGLTHVDFLEGHIETLPLPDASIDCVISNGVINLCPDKLKVFAESARVLRPGGRLAIADIVTEEALTDGIVCNADLWASCIGGAAQEQLYLRAIESAGFTIERQRDNAYEFLSEQARNASAAYGVKSISLLATRTAG